MVFQNDCLETVELFWHSFKGKPISYGKMAPGQKMNMVTYATHPWSAKNPKGHMMLIDDLEVWEPKADDKDRTVHITVSGRYEVIKKIKIEYLDPSSSSWKYYHDGEVLETSMTPDTSGSEEI